jgi:hypothetical protein
MMPSATNRLLAYLTAALVLGAVAHSGLRGWQRVGGAERQTGPSLATVASEGSPSEGPVSHPAARVAEWHLFGRPDTPATAARSQREEAPAPKTQLQLTLRGVATSERGAEARAIIAEPNGKERKYGIGEAVPGGAEVAEILPDRVILVRNGRPETLPLAKLQGSTEGGGNLPRGVATVETPGRPGGAMGMGPLSRFRGPQPAALPGAGIARRPGIIAPPPEVAEEEPEMEPEPPPEPEPEPEPEAEIESQ